MSATPAERAASWLAAWDSQGLHRTATAGDHAGADWLAAEASALGAHVTEAVFDLDRIDARDAFVECDRVRIDGEMLFDAPDTPRDGIVGRAGVEIGVMELSPRAVYAPDFRTMRLAAPHDALLIATRGERPGLALLNAEHFVRPYGPPVLQVASEHAATVLQAASIGAAMRVVTTSERTPARARNTVIELAGRERGRGPLVVMTPRSSWFQSTSERGGGLVCWLECLRALMADPPGMDVVFTANSGHELGHLGLAAFLAHRPGWETDATWVHFGANIGASEGRLSVVSATDSLRGQAVAALRGAGRGPDDVPDGTQAPSGETRDIHLAGGRYITLVGTNPMFHLPQDRWPDAVDLPALTRAARGAADLVVALSR